jgi:hypothetical protein
VDDEALALDEIKVVGPGGNHLARPYTRKHFRRIWQSDFFDTTRHDAWQADGAKTLLDRLQAIGCSGPAEAGPPHREAHAPGENGVRSLAWPTSVLLLLPRRLQDLRQVGGGPYRR